MYSTHHDLQPGEASKHGPASPIPHPLLSQLGGVRWRFASGISPAVQALLADGRWREHAVAIKHNARRTIYRVATKPPLLVKLHHPRGSRERIKALWRKAGLREFAAASRVSAAGVPTAPPVGCGVCGRSSLFVALELPETQKLRDAWQACLQDPPRRALLLQAVARFAAQFVAAGVRHWDMHPGNILVRYSAGSAACFLIDLVGVKITGRAGRVSAWDAVGWLTHLSPQITPGEAATVLLDSGAVPDTVSAVPLWGRLLREFARQAARRWPGRRVRLLQNSSICREVESPEGCWRCLAPVPLAVAQEAVAQHRLAVAADRLLKRDRKRRLSRVTLADWRVAAAGSAGQGAGSAGQGADSAGQGADSAADTRLLPPHLDTTSAVVKEFRHPRSLGRWSADCRSWLTHYRLGPLGLPAATALAWLRGRDGAGYLILSDVGRDNLQIALEDPGCPDRARLLSAAARLIAWLHQRDLFHRDLKATNFVVATDPVFPVYLVDCDDVRFAVRLSPGQQVRGLVQFLDNLQARITSAEAHLVLRTYGEEMGLSERRFRDCLGRMHGHWWMTGAAG